MLDVSWKNFAGVTCFVKFIDHVYFIIFLFMYYALFLLSSQYFYGQRNNEMHGASLHISEQAQVEHYLYITYQSHGCSYGPI